jgi:23S rRNA (cytidine1920-2'-O)/16S rRNA (cytidine1409-2'-O)-methyltransferase
MGRGPHALTARPRLDALLVERGLAPSRERARALIIAGTVRVNGATVDKPGTQLDPSVTITVDSPDHPYVGRGALKLAHALDTFHIAVQGRRALDIGASTGGFTQVLLERGALIVVALDVGHGQLDWSLRKDARVVVRERLNARTLAAEHLPETGRPVEIATIDVSFISLRHILPALPPLLAPDADIVALVKPQFEAGRGEVRKGGIVRDESVHARVVQEVTATAHALGLTRAGFTESPITGMEGNREFFIHLQPFDPSAASRLPRTQSRDDKLRVAPTDVDGGPDA